MFYTNKFQFRFFATSGLAYFISYATIKNKCGADLKQFCLVLRPQNNKIQTVILFLSPFLEWGTSTMFLEYWTSTVFLE